MIYSVHITTNCTTFYNTNYQVTKVVIHISHAQKMKLGQAEYWAYVFQTSYYKGFQDELKNRQN